MNQESKHPIVDNFFLQFPVNLIEGISDQVKETRQRFDLDEGKKPLAFQLMNENWVNLRYLYSKARNMVRDLKVSTSIVQIFLIFSYIYQFNADMPW